MSDDINLEKNSARSVTDVAGIYKDGTYLKNNATWHVGDSPWKARHIATILKKNGLNPSSVCEVGCGAGEILKQLSNASPNINFVGYELSPQAFELCKNRESEKVSYRLKNIFDENVFYDCLLCIDVFEHVEDYMGFIKALKPKANYKIFHIPLDVSVFSILRNSMMNSRKNVGHLHYFTRETALATLVDCGYEIIEGFYTKALDDFPSKTLKAKMMKLPRKILYTISPHWAARLSGGYSYLVLTK